MNAVKLRRRRRREPDRGRWLEKMEWRMSNLYDRMAQHNGLDPNIVGMIWKDALVWAREHIDEDYYSDYGYRAGVVKEMEERIMRILGEMSDQGGPAGKRAAASCFNKIPNTIFADIMMARAHACVLDTGDPDDKLNGRIAVYSGNDRKEAGDRKPGYYFTDVDALLWAMKTYCGTELLDDAKRTLLALRWMAPTRRVCDRSFEWTDAGFKDLDTGNMIQFSPDVIIPVPLKGAVK